MYKTSYKRASWSADPSYRYQIASTAYAAPSFHAAKQYSRSIHEASHPRNPVTSPSPTACTSHARPVGGDYWATATDARHIERAARGSSGSAHRSHATSQAASDIDYRTTRHGVPQRASRPSMAARVATGRHSGQTIRLSNLPPLFSEKSLYKLLEGQGDVQVASCRSTPGKTGSTTAYATFAGFSDAKRAVERLNGLSCGSGRLAVALAYPPSSVTPSAPDEESRDRRSGSANIAQTARGPLVVDGAKSVRPRYKGRHSPGDSDVSDNDSDSQDDGGSSGSDRDVAAVTKKIATMRIDRR